MPTASDVGEVADTVGTAADMAKTVSNFIPGSTGKKVAALADSTKGIADMGS